MKKLLYISSDSDVSEQFLGSLSSNLAIFFDLHILVVTEYNKNLCEKLGVKTIYIDQQKNSTDFKEVEKKFNINLIELCRPYASIYGIKPSSYFNIAANTLIALNDLIKDFDFIFSGNGPEPHHCAAEFIAIKNNIPRVYHGESSLDKDHLFFFSSLMNDIKIFNNRHFKLKKSQSVDPKIISYHTSGKVPKRKFFEKFRQMSLLDIHRSLNIRIRFLLNLISQIIFNIFAKNKFIKSNESKYIFFPLHVIEDSQILLRNFDLRKQDQIIERILNILPDGYKLVVKAHPGMQGNWPYGLLKFILNKKIIYIKNNVPATDILDMVDYLIQITSSVGVEAMKKKLKIAYIGQWKIGEIAGVKRLNLNDSYDFWNFLANDHIGLKYDLDRLEKISFKGNFHAKSNELIDYYEIAKSLKEYTDFYDNDEI